MPTPFVIHANLDCETRWSGIPMPAAVEQRISLYGALLSVLAPAGVRPEVFAPAAVDPTRLVASAAWTPPIMRTGTPPRIDLAWADPAARAANDRRLALALGQRLGVALPGARAIHAVAEIDVRGKWICKAPLSAAGRDRCGGMGPPTAEQRTRLERLLAKCGKLVLEPWCDRFLDVGVCATVAADGTVIAHPPHGILTDARGNFLGIDLSAAALEPAEHEQLDGVVVAAGAAIAETGYRGRFSVDAFAYRDRDARRFHPLCEINARTTFGWIAWAFAAVAGTTRLGFGAAPANATTLVAPTGASSSQDRVTAWIA